MQKKYSITEAASLLGVSRYTLSRRVNRGEIPSTANPLDKREKLIDESVINELLERSGRTRPESAAA